MIDFRKNWHLWHSVSINVRHQNQIRVIYLPEEQYSAYRTNPKHSHFLFQYFAILANREIKKRRGQSEKKTKNVKCKILFYEQVTNRAKFDLAACPRPLISGSDLSA